MTSRASYAGAAPLGRRERIAAACALAAAVAFTAIVCFLKLGSLYAWRYTSDLFTYHQVLAETLAGHFGLEFTYGNTFGDHAYLLLLALLPLEAALGPRTVVALVLLPPLAHLAIAILAVVLVVRAGADVHTSLVAGLLLLLPPGIVEALYQMRYGAHPMDELAGPLAIAMALLLRRQWERPDVGGGWAPALLAVLAFASLKEEMAVLALVFLGTLLLWERKRLLWAAFAIAAATLLVQVVVMQVSATPFSDRTMGLGAEAFVGSLGAGRLAELFTKNQVAVPLVLGALLLAFAASAVLVGHLGRHAVALLMTGLAGVALAVVVRHDLDPGSWHNYPKVVMIAGAVFCQLTVPGAHPRRTRAGAWVLLGMALLSLGYTGVPFARRQLAANAAQLPLAREYGASLRSLLPTIEPEAIVAIPPATAVEFALGGHHRFTFYPRGVSFRPLGIADYLVLQRPRVRIRSFYTPERTRWEIERDHPDFHLIVMNRDFLLLRRVGWTPEGRASRALWVESFGPHALGSGNTWVPAARPERRAPTPLP